MVLETHHPDWEAMLNQIDVLNAERRAIVASWGYDVKVQTREERDAEFKELHELVNGAQDQGLLIADAAEERKWRSDPLRKSMGLQASKPRNAPGKYAKAANAGDDSSDEEEGRSGLGKNKNARRARGIPQSRNDDEVNTEHVMKLIERDPGTVAEDVNTKEEPKKFSMKDPKADSKEVQSLTEKTVRALTEPTDAQQPNPMSFEQDFVEDSQHDEPNAKDLTLRNSVRPMLEHPKIPEHSKKRKFADSADGHIDNQQSANKLPKTAEDEALVDQGQEKEGGPSQVTVSKSKSRRKKEKRNRNQEPKDEEEDKPAPADAEAMARARQLARERLGSGSQPIITNGKKSKKKRRGR